MVFLENNESRRDRHGQIFSQNTDYTTLFSRHRESSFELLLFMYRFPTDRFYCINYDKINSE